ncbi:YhcG family protein [Dyadobacter sp. CY343]|uniref:PDDEXK nuclease domain-containing protein n=1 Tax=Dyadobacter sp. CY343 TaxID=2907299 RepID=UPI001F1EA383|nr:PDDEXK nuclease domain-containing protein [Dyadobacter sp. CY343]MCE7058533.1 PDDEXK nuclease domain-containing protein [Dyadobacter sp. CY343]
MIAYPELVNIIHETHQLMQDSTAKAINKYLTIRNWLIGFYIVEFEQNGRDRAAYGEGLLQKLAESLSQNSLSYRNLKLFRQFYFSYPEIAPVVFSQIETLNSGMIPGQIRNLPLSNLRDSIGQLPIAQLNHTSKINPELLISRLSYTHLVQLFPIDNPVKRSFYEIECMKSNWTVSELRRQINTLYFERSGMSLRPDKMEFATKELKEKPQIADLIKSPFTFEFLGFKSKDVVYENDLEQALVDNLGEFLIELGHGFCFEAKQKRIIIGDEYFFVDLVFYHRILKCHVLIELKTNELKHEHIGQLKTYINYYKKEVMATDDNPPVGLLLVTDRNKALVEYAVADSDLPLFVSKYLVELPTKEQLAIFIQKELLKS